MKKINKPDFNVSDVIQCLLNDLQNSGEVLINNQACMVAKEDSYNQNAINTQLYQIPRLKDALLQSYYKELSSEKNKTARRYYDALRLLSSICPYCNEGVSSQLDHFLPQRQYADLSITPINLIPCCKDCNQNKLTRTPSSQDDQLIHPYFDDFNKGVWLYARIYIEDTVYTSFYILKNDALIDIEHNRILNHFNIMKLNTLYSIKANTALQNLQHLFILEPNKIREILQVTIGSINTWKHALYNAVIKLPDEKLSELYNILKHKK